MTPKTSLRARRAACRRGYSLAELLVGMVLLGIISTLFTRLLLSQSRFFDLQSASNSARNVSRGPINRIVSDLRMVEAEGGVIAATTSAITVRVPYAIGVVCSTQGSPSETEVTLLPVDSVMYNAPGFYGYAWRDNSTGHYSYVETDAWVGDKIVSGACTTAGITNLTNGPRIALKPGLPTAATLGTPVMLFRRVKYEFASSVIVPGRIGLFRTVLNPNGSQTSEELSAPFASTASFGFYTLGSNAPSSVPPADLTTLRGFELHLDGMSEGKASGKTVPTTTPFTTAVFFKNRIT
jgi:prepilin-type N-terminal cleavage/methylation domain-containing protein